MFWLPPEKTRQVIVGKWRKSFSIQNTSRRPTLSVSITSLHSAHSSLWHQVGTGSLSTSSIRLYLGFLSTGLSTIIVSQRCKRSRLLNWWILQHVNPWIVNVEFSMEHLVRSNTICSSNEATKLVSLTITPRDARDTGRINVEVSGV